MKISNGLETTYLLNYQEKDDIAFFKHYATNEISTKEEVLEVIRVLNNFIECNMTDQYIDEYNKRVSEEYRRDWEDMQMGRGRYAPKPQKETKRRQFSNTRTEKGFVYFIQEKMTGTVKIGRAKDLKGRLRTFGVKLPFEWDQIHVVESNDYILTELLFHDFFNQKRKNGEWFELTDEDIAWIISEEYSEEVKSSIIGKGVMYEEE